MTKIEQFSESAKQNLTVTQNEKMGLWIWYLALCDEGPIPQLFVDPSELQRDLPQIYIRDNPALSPYYLSFFYWFLTHSQGDSLEVEKNHNHKILRYIRKLWLFR